jgi:putative ABC transport system permease protein
MLKNFFKTAFRNIVKYKAYSLINFVGLTCGLTLALLIITYVRSEIGYDRFHEKADRLYRFRYTAPNGLEIASSPPPIAPVLKDYFPEVEETARLYLRNVSITRPSNPEAFEESNILFADSAITKMFTFDFVKGNPKRALCDKFTVLINEEMAKKYFGDANPIGESLIFSGRNSFKVVGVVKDFPEQSHLRFNMLVPYDNMFDLETPETAKVLRDNLAINFIISHSYTYVLLKPGTTPAHINQEMGAFMKKYAQPRFLVGQVFQLMPMVDIHLKSTLLAEPSTTNSMANLYIFIGIGVLTLIIACINYINLSTAQSFTRIKEIGIRKILGSMKYQLILQFLAESFLFSLVSMVIAYFAFHFMLPLLNLLTGKHLVFWEAVDGKLLVASALLLVFITALAGGYPAYFVTQFESVNALKGRGGSEGGNQFLRKALVVFQLAIACMLLSASLLIVKQLHYLEDRPLGFQKSQVINIPLASQNLNGIFSQRDSVFSVRLQTFRDRAEGLSGVKQTTLSSGAPGLGVVYRGIIPEGFTAEDNLFIANMSVDYDFLKSYDMEVVAGRGFSRNYGTDPAEAYVVNETAVREFKWETPEKAIGKTVNKEGKKGKVVGVVKDFNFASLTVPMSALVMDLSPDQFNTLSITFANTDGHSIIQQLEGDWNKLFPEKAFEYSFLDESLQSQYSNYENFGTIIQSFTGIAILISCLGVYGLVLFTVQRKVKEIGVRKVLGANVRSILVLIYRDFALLIAIGFCVAVPLSYYFMNQWLSNFIYHTEITSLTFVISLVSVLAIVTLTVSYQAIRAALANPVKSLRSE